MNTAEVTIQEMVEDGQCPHETLRDTTNPFERFCFDCGGFINPVTGVLSLDGKTRTPFDDDIDAAKAAEYEPRLWATLLDSALILAMGSPDRPTTRAIFRAHREWVAAAERAEEWRVD